MFSDCSVSCAMMMAVEDMATAPPMSTATAGATSKNRMAPAATIPTVISTCAPPTPSTSQRMATRRGSENSNPKVNTRNTTPKSANNCVVSLSAARLRACGPNSMPTARYPKIAGSANLRTAATTHTDAVSRIRICNSGSLCPIAC